MMATTNPQDETGTTNAPHARPDEHQCSNISEDYLSFNASEGYPTPDLVEECSIPGHSEEHLSSNHSEEHPNSDLSEEHPNSSFSRSIEKLFRDFEANQKQQLQILRAITHRVCSARRGEIRNIGASA